MKIREFGKLVLECSPHSYWYMEDGEEYIGTEYPVEETENGFEITVFSSPVFGEVYASYYEAVRALCLSLGADTKTARKVAGFLNFRDGFEERD